MRVWDVFLSEGWKVIFRICLALLQLSEGERARPRRCCRPILTPSFRVRAAELLGKSLEETMEYFRYLPAKVCRRTAQPYFVVVLIVHSARQYDVETIFNAAFKLRLSHTHMTDYERECTATH